MSLDTEGKIETDSMPIPKLINPEEKLAQMEKMRGITLGVNHFGPLEGRIENLGGAKNAGFKEMMAAASRNGLTKITGLSLHGDVYVTAIMLKSLGCDVKLYDNGTTEIDSSKMVPDVILPAELGEASRASILLAGVLLARFGKATIPKPGGDKLGERSTNYHTEVLQALGAKYEDTGDHLVFTTDGGLKPGSYEYKKPSHMATEQGLIAAASIEGKSVLINAAREPEVDDLIELLRKSGAEITSFERDGKRVLEIVGSKNRNTGVVEHNVLLDRNAIVTYAIAAIVSGSEVNKGGGIFIKGAKSEHLESFLKLLDEMHGGYEVTEEGIRFFYKEPLWAPTSILVTAPEGTKLPEGQLAIMTDWQALISVLALKASKGTRKTNIVETVFADRFAHLRAMHDQGASTVEFYDPREKEFGPNNEKIEVTYLFNEEEKNIKPQPHGATIEGGPLPSSIILDGNDVRLGAFGILLGISLPPSELELSPDCEIKGLYHIERGYNHLIRTLMDLGQLFFFYDGLKQLDPKDLPI